MEKAKFEADVEQIEDRRPANPGMDALYFLSPQTHILDCLLADFERRWYRKSYIIWTSGQRAIPQVYHHDLIALTVGLQQPCHRSYVLD